MARLLTVLMLLLLIAGCNKSADLGVPGLQLPAVAKLVDRSEDKETISLSFDSPEDWLSTKAYFDSNLSKLYFTHDVRKDELIAQIKAKHPDWDQAKLEEKYAWVMRESEKISGGDISEWENPTSGFNISLINLKAGQSRATQLDPSAAKKMAGLGDYSLLIHKPVK